MRLLLLSLFVAISSICHADPTESKVETKVQVKELTTIEKMENMTTFVAVLIDAVEAIQAKDYRISAQAWKATQEEKTNWEYDFVKNMILPLQPGALKPNQKENDPWINPILKELKTAVKDLTDLLKDEADQKTIYDHFDKMDYASRNALASAFFYIESVKRSYLLKESKVKLDSDKKKEVKKLLVDLDGATSDVFDSMHELRWAAEFGVKKDRLCIECSLGILVKTGIVRDDAIAYVPFPYYHNGEHVIPKLSAPATYVKHQLPKQVPAIEEK